jgi:hypothetical protein
MIEVEVQIPGQRVERCVVRILLDQLLGTRQRPLRLVIAPVVVAAQQLDPVQVLGERQRGCQAFLRTLEVA